MAADQAISRSPRLRRLSPTINQQFGPKPFHELVTALAVQDQLLTSWFTVGEVLTKPRELGDSILVKSHRAFFQESAIELVAFEAESAKKYAEIRSRARVKPPDAIQLACAAATRADLFVTNDDRLSNLVVPGITFITGITKIPY